ncbi:MAG: precorrin-6y C5,15-methyltransferase (decarboxylating) subunit CbiE [Actinomycetales bacterium]
MANGPDQPIEVIGVGPAGFEGLSATGRDLVRSGDVVLAAGRLLDTVPVRPGQERRTWPSPLREGLPALLQEFAGRRVVVLASGDPLVSGVGSTLIRLLGAPAVRIYPDVSSVALARARMGWPAESCETVSLVSAPVDALRRWIAPGARLVVLSAGRRTPGEIARVLRETGWESASVTVLGRLGSVEESRLDATAGLWPDEQERIPALNIVAVHLDGTPDAAHERQAFQVASTAPGLPDEAFEHDGQLSKWEVRIAALAALRPIPGELLWDLGAGAGSVGIEWARHHPRCVVVAVERDPQRAARIAQNAAVLGVPGQVQVVQGAAAHCLDELPDPDAIFVGGGASAEVVDACWARLRLGGRLVMHGVTAQTEQVLVAAFEEYGGQLRRLSVERAEPLGRFTGWTPARTVVHWGVVKTTESRTDPAADGSNGDSSNGNGSDGNTVMTAQGGRW